MPLLIILVFISSALLTAMITTYLGGNILATGVLPLVVGYFACKPLVYKYDGKDKEDAFQQYMCLLRCEAIAHYVGNSQYAIKALASAKVAMIKFNENSDSDARLEIDRMEARKNFVHEIETYKYSADVLEVILRESVEMCKLK